jgi:hypothetical protein
MPLLIQKSWFTWDEVGANLDKIYVFGDNEARTGKGGQAKACRDHFNTIGIRTKALPGTDPEAYWTDDNFISNVYMVVSDFALVEECLKDGRTVIFPEDGFGTGLANLAQNAPRTLNVIRYITTYLINKYS